MMKLKQALSLMLLVTGTLAIQAQAPTPHLIEFDETTHDFGTKDQGASTEHIFKFKNISTDVVRLTGVKASCGCTTPEWSKDDIPPGKQGEIKVSYNSQRVGAFHKSVSVNYNDRVEPLVIYIKGEVTAKDPNPISEETTVKPVVKPAPALPAINYSMPRGALSFETTVQNVKVVNSEEEIEVEFRYKNTSSLPVRVLKDQTLADADLTLVFKDDELAPNQESILKVKLSGKAMKENGQMDGYFSRNFAFFTDEAQGGKKELTISGNYKRTYTEAEKEHSPRIAFETTSVEGGKIIEGEKYVYDFAFTNTGKSPLKILSAKASCGCTAIKPITESIAPGERAAITATFDSKGRVGMQSKSITVTTNDIENPTIGLRFTVEVVKDPFHAGGMVDQ